MAGESGHHQDVPPNKSKLYFIIPADYEQFAAVKLNYRKLVSLHLPLYLSYSAILCSLAKTDISD